jgi:hypothetical protein
LNKYKKPVLKHKEPTTFTEFNLKTGDRSNHHSEFRKLNHQKIEEMKEIEKVKKEQEEKEEAEKQK